MTDEQANEAAKTTVTEDFENKELIEKYATFHNYDWKSDNFYKKYLSQLLSKNLAGTSTTADDESNHDILIMRSRIWFYNKKFKGNNINLQKYISLINSKKLNNVYIPEFEQQSPYFHTPDAAGTQEEEEQDDQAERLSYDQLVQLITNGEEIPGIKKIEPIVNIGQESQSVLKPRKKPWE